MNIELRHLIPFPLIEVPHPASEIWEKESVVFKEGEIISVIAGSGKGKTSLLSCIYGIRKDFKGDILIDGISIIGFSSRTWANYRKRRISYIFQGLELFDELSALDNILVKNSISGFKTEAQIKDMAEKIGMREYLGKKTAKLSYGQKQRIAILRALCQKMDFLLADEIFSHIDNKTSSEVYQLIRDELREQGAGLIMTSLDEIKGFDFNRTISL